MVGNITQPNDVPLPNRNSKIYMLDVRSYTWVYTFEAPSNASTTTSIPNVGGNPSIPTSTPSESNKQLETMKVVIAAIGSILGTVFLMSIGFFCYKRHQARRQRERPSEMRVHGNAYYR